MASIVKAAAFLVEKRADAFVVKCGSCNGEGRYFKNSSHPCDVCKGVGRVILTIKEEWAGRDVGLVACGSCRQAGRYLKNDSHPCEACSGVGVALRCFPRLVCGSCSGDGRYIENSTHPCDVCSGIGSVWVETLQAI